MQIKCRRTGEAERGFTLVELLVTLAVVAIVSTYAVPGFSHLFEKMQLEGDQSDVLKALKDAKRFARSESTVVRVELKSNGSSPDTVVMRPVNGSSVTTTLSSVGKFEKEQTIIFTASGTVIPPSDEPMYSIVLESDSSEKRYVEVTASGQIAGQYAGYTPHGN